MHTIYINIRTHHSTFTQNTQNHTTKHTVARCATYAMLCIHIHLRIHINRGKHINKLDTHHTHSTHTKTHKQKHCGLLVYLHICSLVYLCMHEHARAHAHAHTFAYSHKGGFFVLVKSMYLCIYTY
jgi:hypothetical protein